MTHDPDDARLDSALDTRIDEKLREAYAPPEGLGDRLAAAVAARHAKQGAAIQPIHAARTSTQSLATRWGLVAAALLVGSLLTWWGLGGQDAGSTAPDAPLVVGGEGGSIGRGVGSSIGDIYAESLAAARSAGSVCNVVGDLEQSIQERLGVLLELDPDPAWTGPVTVTSWPSATVLAARLDSDPVVLLMDVRARDPQLEQGSIDGVLVRRQELGPLVVYELSNAAAMSCLPALRIAEVPAEHDR